MCDLTAPGIRAGVISVTRTSCECDQFRGKFGKSWEGPNNDATNRCSAQVGALSMERCVGWDIVGLVADEWIGPFFVTFPNLRDAMLNHVPVQTKARACTILPSFVG